MNIEKLKSGSYRIRQMYKGKRYSITVDHKPTQKEAVQLMAKELDKIKCDNRLTVKKACEQYIESKTNIISPSTMKLYNMLMRKMDEDFSKIPIDLFTQEDLNREINRYSVNHAPSTVQNYHGFIAGVLAVYKPDFTPKTKLPQKKKKEPYIPTPEEVKMILDDVKGTRYEIPFMLASYGMRRSEIFALTPDDLDGNVLTINKARVQGLDYKYVTKGTKTTQSTRKIIIPDYLADLIRERGSIYDGDPQTLSVQLRRSQDKLGITPFTFHKFRHYFASILSSMNVADADIMKMGGWSTDAVMKTVYRHAMINQEKEKEISDKLATLIL